MNKLLENSKVRITTACIVLVFLLGLVVGEVTWKVNVWRDVQEIKAAQEAGRWNRDDQRLWVTETELIASKAGRPWKGAAVRELPLDDK